MSRSKSSHANETRSLRWAARLDRMPKLARIILSLLIALLLGIVAWVVISGTLFENILLSEKDPLPTLWIAVVLGLVFYGIGWWAMVGFDDGPWRAGKPAVYYAALGMLALIVLVILALFGLLFGYVL